jgi:hypothetical protein
MIRSQEPLAAVWPAEYGRHRNPSKAGGLGVIVNGSGWINRHTALVAVIADAARSTM